MTITCLIGVAVRDRIEKRREIVRIHLAIAVDDLDAAREFYTKAFGFEELRRPDFGFPGMWL